jgi:hypothetical protein
MLRIVNINFICCELLILTLYVANIKIAYFTEFFNMNNPSTNLMLLITFRTREILQIFEGKIFDLSAIYDKNIVK